MGELTERESSGCGLGRLASVIFCKNLRAVLGLPRSLLWSDVNHQRCSETCSFGHIGVRRTVDPFDRKAFPPGRPKVGHVSKTPPNHRHDPPITTHIGPTTPGQFPTNAVRTNIPNRFSFRSTLPYRFFLDGLGSEQTGRRKRKIDILSESATPAACDFRLVHFLSEKKNISHENNEANETRF